MKLIVHGTKGGYRTLFSTPNAPLSVARDIRPYSSNENTIGQKAYSLSFVENGVVYTVYRIVRDVGREKATGNIAFSLYISNGKKILGNIAKQIIDEISEIYYTRYAPGGNLDVEREEWSFINDTLDKFKNEVEDTDKENFDAGTKDAAYIYYVGSDEVVKYFNEPFRDQYRDYRQVFFINNQLKGKPEDPIQALRHSPDGDLTGKINLNDIRYKLYIDSFNNGITTTVKVNGMPLVSGSKFWSESMLDLMWQKPYYRTENVSGKLRDINNDALKVDTLNKTLRITTLQLTPEQKIINIEVQHRKGHLIQEVEISCNNSQGVTKEATNNQITFEGEELGMQWKVEAKKGEDFVPSIWPFTPVTVNDVIVLRLIDKLKVNVKITEDSNNNIIVWVDTILVDNKPHKCSDNKIELLGDETERELSITVKHHDYEEKTKRFNAKKESEIIVKLQKKKKYTVDAGEYGKKREGYPDYTFNSSGNDLPKRLIKSNKSYKFIGWKLDENKKQKGYNGTIIAQYRKRKTFYKNPKLIAAATVFLLVAGVGVYLLLDGFKFGDSPAASNDKFTLSDTTRIILYVDGDELLLDTLEDYVTKWENIKIPKENLLVKLFPKIKKSLPPRDSIPLKQNEFDSIKSQIKNKLDSAKHIRTLIAQNRFEELKSITHYSSKQEDFKNAILGFNERDSSKINFKDSVNIDSLTLKCIAEIINNLPNNSNSKEESGKTDVHEATKQEAKALPTNDITDDRNKEIIDYILGNELRKKKLQEYKEISNLDASIIKSIDYCIKLWDLDGSKDNLYSSLLTEVRNDKNLKNSELIKFLQKMNKQDNPKYLSNLPGYKKIRTLKELNDSIAKN